MNRTAFLLALLLGLTATACASYDDGMPYGKISEREVENFSNAAKRSGQDVVADLQLAYRKDGAALARVFGYSAKLKKLDKHARVYGQLIYSSLLNLSESKVLDYAQVLAAQSPEIRQRIRDFLYYPATQLPANQRAQVETEMRRYNAVLFPPDYVFGKNNPLFAK